MEERDAIKALACLGHEIRMRLFRHLVRCGFDGDSSGNMATAMGLAPSTMSFHLGQLEEAGLARSWRVSRSVRYAADLRMTRNLLLFILSDCCHGDPMICADLFAIDNEPGRTGADGEPAPDRPGGNIMTEDKIFNVLFLCTGNSARSIMAESILNRLGQGRFRAFSAGSQPRGQINPHTIQLLKRDNYPTGALRSKSWEKFSGDDAPKMDFVFTVCDSAAKETCPVWPGQPMSAHWGLPDPAEVQGDETERHLAYADAMRYLTNRISIFVNLPIRSLDKLSLQKRLESIGTIVPEKKSA